tara:strand:+ start:840 stop:1067 length:228 start_codon:yes stop_codon:yes gene_type:complete
MKSNNFPDKEILAMTPNMEGVTRPLKDEKTKKFTFILKGIGIGTAPMKISTNAETKAKAIKYIKARWKDCSYELI